jgi:hypothetical protein
MNFIPIIAISLSKVSLTDLAAILTALGGIIIGILTARRTSKSDKVTQDNSQRQSLLEGYGQIVKDLQHEIERIRTQYEQDLDRWTKEKTALENEKAIFLKQLELLQAHASDLKPTRRSKKKVVADDSSSNNNSVD